MSIDKGKNTFEGGFLSLKGSCLEMPQLLFSKEVMITCDSYLQVRKQFPVIVKVIRNVVGFKAIDYFFVSTIASFEERDVFDHIKCEGISCGDVVNGHFDSLLPSRQTFLSIFVSEDFGNGKDCS